MPFLFSYGTLQQGAVQHSLLAKADHYEPAGYQRIVATLASGQQAWVYADARFS